MNKNNCELQIYILSVIDSTLEFTVLHIENNDIVPFIIQ